MSMSILQMDLKDSLSKFKRQYVLAFLSRSNVCLVFENLTTTGVKINEDFIGEIRTQHKSGRTTVDVIINSDCKVSTTITVNETLTGLKISFALKVLGHKSRKEVLIELYLTCILLICNIPTIIFSMNTTTDLTSTHLVELATTVGTSELVIGAEVGFDITSDAVTKYNSGAGYNKFDFSASLLM
ncbi:hypothetical protein ZEAMMB73_Zm00001d040779 [Zea mays]|uniref:Uncharacterized protein n=1 Tax=Zea mays TaxID=4577 RepID=A0A1D6MSW8_MAIZE|nr:hypothetical protein ZEAMMB73_Zm00001d040779 [Zea mays]